MRLVWPGLGLMAMMLYSEIKLINIALPATCHASYNTALVSYNNKNV
jgi:hypothetical protein